MNILIADDITDWARPLADRLVAAGHSAEIEFWGNEVVGRLKKGSFDLLLLDIFFAESDGADATATIYPNVRMEFPDLPIIIMSAQDSIEIVKTINWRQNMEDMACVIVPKVAGANFLIGYLDRFQQTGTLEDPSTLV